MGLRGAKYAFAFLALVGRPEGAKDGLGNAPMAGPKSGRRKRRARG